MVRHKQMFSVAEAFFDALYGDKREICFQIFPDNRETSVGAQWRYGRLEDLWEWLVEKNNKGAGIFFMVNKGDLKGRSTDNVVEVKHLFVDLDGSPMEPLHNILTQPHVIIESSPGRFHAYWRITELDLKDFRNYQVALAKRFGADQQVNDLPRVMRVPGFFHLKKKPFLTRICKLSKLKPWNPKVLVKALGLDISNGDGVAPAISGSSEKFSEGERHRKLLSACGRLRNSGLEGEAFIRACYDLNQLRCNPPLPEPEVRKIAEYLLKREAAHISAPEDIGDPAPTEANVQRVSFSELYAKELPSVRWVIHDLLPAGLTILAGDPKVGKSWLVQHLSLAVASGGLALQAFETNEGDVLHLALEDSLERWKTRMLKLLGDAEPPERGWVLRECPGLPRTIGFIEEWLKQAEDPRLVVIDTFARIRGIMKKGDGAYERDYREVSALQKLAQDYQIALILVHHLNKGEQENDFRKVSGTQGLTGASDSNWILTTDREKHYGVLATTGREIEDRRLWLEMDLETGTWRYVGTADDLAKNEAEEVLLDAMMDFDEPVTVATLATYIGKSRQKVNKVLRRLVSKGIVQPSVCRGKYVLCKLLHSPKDGDKGLQACNYKGNAPNADS